MNVLLIGGTGFMGSGLANYFNQKGHYVVTVGRSDLHTVPRIKHYNVAAMGWPQIVTELKERADWIALDLAYTSVPNTSFTDPIKDFSDNLYLVNRHLEFMEALKVKRYIYISSGGTVYGEPVRIPIPETAGNFPLSPYGITKMAAERYVYMHHRVYEFPAIIVRPSNIYGPGQIPFRGQGFIATALGLAVKGSPVQVYGNGDQERDYLFIDDFCSGIDAVVSKGKPGEIYNLGSGNGLSLNRIVETINELITSDGTYLPKTYQPARPFDVKQNVLDCTKARRACQDLGLDKEILRLRA
jgi:UDP-glucose 4-epimerase